jgi:1-acyl-sn-glycerol-3-phosphate acyltransferase
MPLETIDAIQTTSRPRRREFRDSLGLTGALPQSGVGSGPAHREMLPKVSAPWLRWFTWYSRRYCQRHFHSLRVSRSGMPPELPALPLVIYSNHASWWDALVCLVLKDEFFGAHTAFAPVDAAMLQRYKFFARLGFFGVEQHTRRGARRFLRVSEVILQSPRHLLALTPQGRFADARERPVRFAAGLGHLAARQSPAVFLPLAIEYVFWEERLPEILVRFGKPVVAGGGHKPRQRADAWTGFFEGELSRTQDALAAESQRRRPEDFETLLRGGGGQGGIYDWWRAFKAAWRGETFRKEHGNK